MIRLEDLNELRSKLHGITVLHGSFVGAIINSRLKQDLVNYVRKKKANYTK